MQCLINDKLNIVRLHGMCMRVEGLQYTIMLRNLLNIIQGEAGVGRTSNGHFQGDAVAGLVEPHGSDLG